MLKAVKLFGLYWFYYPYSQQIFKQAMNTKTIQFILTENQAARINSTPALRLSHNRLVKVGHNQINVNHYEYSHILRMWAILGINIF